jgi:hypothetical protein
LRARLVPEWPIYALLADRPSPSALAGRIDAIAYEGDHTETVIDWKSDIDPDKTDMRRHAHQLEDYLRATGTVRGALVYMTLGVFRWVMVGALSGGVGGRCIDVAGRGQVMGQRSGWRSTRSGRASGAIRKFA